jgi:hypothetical protein
VDEVLEVLIGQVHLAHLHLLGADVHDQPALDLRHRQLGAVRHEHGIGVRIGDHLPALDQVNGL